MRVVMIGPFGLRPKGTMSVRALPLAKALAARGHQVTLLLPPWSWPQHSGQLWSEDGVAVENIALPPGIPLLWHLLITWRLLRRALALRPDVIHCFKPKAYSGLAAWMLWRLRWLRLTRARLVVDSDDWEGFGGWNDLEPYTWPQKRFFAWQEQWGLRHNDALTVASRALQSIAWSLGLPPERVHYVPNGLQDFSVEALKIRRGDGQTVLLYTRFFEFQPERVVAVFQAVHEAKPNVHFLVGGKGLFGEETRFLELCRAAGLSEAVQYIGWIEPDELPAHLARADIAIYPFDDTLINRTKCAVKLLELMAAGVPIVAEAVGQNAVTIEHGLSGMLVPSGQAETFAGTIIHLLDDPALRDQLGRGAQRRIQTHFTWERLAAQVEQAYSGNERTNNAETNH